LIRQGETPFAVRAPFSHLANVMATYGALWTQCRRTEAPHACAEAKDTLGTKFMLNFVTALF